VRPRAGLDATEKIKISYYCRKSNPDFSVVQAVAQSPYRLSYPVRKAQNPLYWIKEANKLRTSALIQNIIYPYFVFNIENDTNHELLFQP
jgi:hypothetical protein